MKNMSEDFELCNYIEKRTPELVASITGVEKPMCANVDLYSGIVYSTLDIPLDVATPLFATARLSGWTAPQNRGTYRRKKTYAPCLYKCSGAPGIFSYQKQIILEENMI